MLLADIVDKATRSRMMAAIKGKNTKPEIIVRKALHAAGFRFRLHDAKLPGKPDIVLKKYKAVIFVHGCFWHGHDCAYFHWPKSRKQFWRTKIEGNQKRDASVKDKLLDSGWRSITVWECAIREKNLANTGNVIDRCIRWLRSNSKIAEIWGGCAK